MTQTHRVRAIRPDVYILEKKRWYGRWTNCLMHFDGWELSDKTFPTAEEAKEAFWEMQSRKNTVAPLPEYLP